MVRKILYGGDAEVEFNKDVFDIYSATNSFNIKMEDILKILEQRQSKTNSSNAKRSINNSSNSNVSNINRRNSNTTAFAKEYTVFKKEQDNKKLLFFTVDESKRILFQDCIQQNDDLKEMSMNVSVNDVKQLRVVFTWESVLLFGTQEQQQAFNKFRREYVEYIIRSFCKEGCEYNVIGTPAISPQSDMDYDLSGMNIPDIIAGISEIHSKYFPHSLDVTFDVNLYGTVFNFVPHEEQVIDTMLNNRQKMWSFMRIVETVLSLKTDERKYFVSSLNPVHQRIFKEAFKQLRDEFQLIKTNVNVKTATNVIIDETQTIRAFETVKSKSLQKYASFLKQYTKQMDCFKPQRQNVSCYNVTFNDLVESFSRAKFYENETYRSLGAVLHIVQKRDNFVNRLKQEEYYLHSIYDNFGFVVENLLHEKLCGKLFKPSVLKVAKYVSRIINAMSMYDSKYYENNEYYKTVANAANKLNNARRGTNVRTIDNSYDEFLYHLNGNQAVTDNLTLVLTIYNKLIKAYENS